MKRFINKADTRAFSVYDFDAAETKSSKSSDNRNEIRTGMYNAQYGWKKRFGRGRSPRF